MTPSFKCSTDPKIALDVTTGKIASVFKKHFPGVESVFLCRRRKWELLAERKLLSQ